MYYGRPRERGDPYAAASRLGTVIDGFRATQLPVVMGPGSRCAWRDDGTRHDVETVVRILAARCVRGLKEFHCPPGRGCGNAGRLMHPQLPTPKKTNKRAQSLQIHQNTRRSARNGLRVIACSPRRSGFLTPSPADKNSASLTPTLRRQDHTTSPSASAPFVKGASTSTASRPTYRDDREPPPWKERDGGIII
jgi:hypothetical protein